MAVTALILFDQGGPGTAGEAFEGTVAGGLVTVTNDDDTDILSWHITLLDVPPDSGLVAGTTLGSADSGTPSATFTPDVAGSYRIMLDVWDATGESGTKDRDIRNFGVRNADGIIIPPYQKLPDPLPVTGSGLPGAKPDEQNYGGQARGWAGDRASGQLEQFFETFRDQPFRTAVTSGLTAPISDTAPYTWIVTPTVTDGDVLLPTPARVGTTFRIVNRNTAGFMLNVNLPGGHLVQELFDPYVLEPQEAKDFMWMGGTDWTLLNAARSMDEQSLVASTEDTDLVGFAAIGASVLLDPADFENLIAVTWQAVIETSDAGDSAEVRLFNVTTASVVGGTTLSTTSLTPVVVSAAVTLASGPNLYEAQLRLTTTGTPNRATCKQARLLIDTLG